MCPQTAEWLELRRRGLSLIVAFTQHDILVYLFLYFVVVAIRVVPLSGLATQDFAWTSPEAVFYIPPDRSNAWMNPF